MVRAMRMLCLCLTTLLLLFHSNMALLDDEQYEMDDELFLRDYDEVERDLDMTKINLSGKTAGQTSTYKSFGPYRAFDGKSDTFLRQGSCTQTVRRRNPVWRVNLGGEFCIAKVTILNRGESVGIASRLEGALVRIGLSGVIAANAGCGPRVTLDEAKVAGGTIVRQCEKPIKGRYVSVGKLDAYTALSLCEVEVYQVPMEECEG